MGILVEEKGPPSARTEKFYAQFFCWRGRRISELVNFAFMLELAAKLSSFQNPQEFALILQFLFLRLVHRYCAS